MIYLFFAVTLMISVGIVTLTNPIDPAITKFRASLQKKFLKNK